MNWNGRDYADHLVSSKMCNAISAEVQKKYLLPKQTTTSAPRLVNEGTVRSSNITTQMQIINNHLAPNKRIPQNVPSYQPRISPSMDFNSNHTTAIQPQAATNNQVEHMASHYMPTFMSDTLIVNGRHQVYVSDVDDGPYMFSIQLKNSEQKMEEMMADIAKCTLTQISRKPALGMACLARFSEDSKIYRVVIKSIYPDSCQLLYVDYGNSEKAQYNNIFDIPEKYLRLKTFAVRVSLAGLKTLPALPEHVKGLFKDMVTDKVLDMVVVPPDGKTFVQYCELTIDGESMLDRLKEISSGLPKFIEPTPLSNDDFVVIRYVESPKLFCVQQTKNITEYNLMMDKLLQYCLTAPTLSKYDIGIACAARYKNDTEWYRAEILKVSGSNAMIRFVDYGIVLTIETDKLKEISYTLGYDFLVMPKQAVTCCLRGFDSLQTISGSSQDQMELLAEDSLGERRNFRVKIDGQVNDIVLVNLTDESQLPNLDLSMRMLQLSMSQKSFRELMNKQSATRQNIAPPTNNMFDRHANAGSNGSAMLDSGFAESTTANSSASIWDTPEHNNKPKSRTSASNNNREDSGIFTSSLRSSEHHGVEDKHQHYANPSFDNRYVFYNC